MTYPAPGVWCYLVQGSQLGEARRRLEEHSQPRSSPPGLCNQSKRLSSFSLPCPHQHCDWVRQFTRSLEWSHTEADNKNVEEPTKLVSWEGQYHRSWTEPGPASFPSLKGFSLSLPTLPSLYLPAFLPPHPTPTFSFYIDWSSFLTHTSFFLSPISTSFSLL